MITDSFDLSRPIITPGDFYEAKNLCSIAMPIFSVQLYNELRGMVSCRRVGELHSCAGVREVQLADTGEVQFAFYPSSLGSALASLDLIDVAWMTGARHFITFGSAGSLNGEVTKGKYVLPTAAYRDEGMSYHYAPAGDYMQVPNHVHMERICKELQIPYVTGRAWTTDSFYTETVEAMKKRVSEGCLAVEMELAGLQAVCGYYGWELYSFLQTGDVLDTENAYDATGLSEANHSTGKLDLALAVVKDIHRRQQEYKEGRTIC